MIIKYLVSHLIFKIINFLPAGKICNYLNYYLVVYLGSNHKRRLWNLKKTILKQEHLDFEKIDFENIKKFKKIFIFVGDSHAEFYGRNFLFNNTKKKFFTYHTGPTMLTTFGTSRKLILKIFQFIKFIENFYSKNKPEINIIFSFGEIDIRTYFYQELKIDKNFASEKEFIDFISKQFIENFKYLKSLILFNKMKKINFFFKEMTPQTYSKYFTPKNSYHLQRIRENSNFPVVGNLKNRVMWSKKLSIKLRLICNQNKIKFIQLNKNVYDKNGSLKKKISFDDGHISNLTDLIEVQKKIMSK